MTIFIWKTTLPFMFIFFILFLNAHLSKEGYYHIVGISTRAIIFNNEFSKITNTIENDDYKCKIISIVRFHFILWSITLKLATFAIIPRHDFISFAYTYLKNNFRIYISHKWLGTLIYIYNILILFTVETSTKLFIF